jgi:hypothetical protein
LALQTADEEADQRIYRPEEGNPTQRICELKLARGDAVLHSRNSRFSPGLDVFGRHDGFPGALFHGVDGSCDRLAELVLRAYPNEHTHPGIGQNCMNA